jgi:hypothetical protein
LFDTVHGTSFSQVLERGERIELLVDKTDRLNQTSFKFEKSSRQLKQVCTVLERVRACMHCAMSLLSSLIE